MQQVKWRRKIGIHGLAFFVGWIGTRLLISMNIDTVPNGLTSIGPFIVGAILVGIVHILYEKIG